MDTIHIEVSLTSYWSEAETVMTHFFVFLPELFIWHVICDVLWSTYLCISGSCLSEFSFSHVEVTTVLLSLHGCRRDVLLDLCCDLFAPGLNIWLSPQAPSACLGLYVGLSIEHWGPITLRGPVRTWGLASWLIHKNTYQDMQLLCFWTFKAEHVLFGYYMHNPDNISLSYVKLLTIKVVMTQTLLGKKLIYRFIFKCTLTIMDINPK